MVISLSHPAPNMAAMDAPLDLQQTLHPTRKLRIAVVTETYPPEVNGVAMTTGRVVDGLLRLGHRVQLVRLRQGGNDGAAPREGFDEVLSRGVPIPRYSHLRVGLPARGTLQRLWENRRPDVVQVVTEGPLGWSAVAAARRLGLPVITEFHTNFHSYSSYYGIGWLKPSVQAYLRRFHNRGDLCLAPTAALAAALGGDGIGRVKVVARGVDTQLFSPAKRSAALRRAWGANEGTLVVAVVGRLAAEKNLGLALRAFDALRAVTPAARMVFVGDGPARAALQAARPDCIFAGMRLGEDLAAHYASADLFLFPSTTETFGNVTTEALASGVPVVAFNYAAAAEHVRHGFNGGLAPFADDSAFVAAAVQAAADAGRCRELAHNARSSVLGVDWAAIVAGLTEIIEEVVQGHEARKVAA